jgi:hypothetical protein
MRPRPVPIVTKRGIRYSLNHRGFDDGAEYFGFVADNDEDAIDISLNFVSRFVVPLQIGNYLYEAGPLWKERLTELSNTSTGMGVQ